MLRWLGFTAALIILGYIAYVTPWTAVANLFITHWALFIPVALLRFLPLAVVAESTRCLLLGKMRRDYFFCFRLTWIRIATQILMPPIAGFAGEVLAVFILRSGGVKTVAAITVMTLSSLIGLFTIALFCMSSLFCFFFIKIDFNPVYVVSISVGIFVLLCLLVVGMLHFKVLQKIVGVAQKFFPKKTEWRGNASKVERWFKWYFCHWAILLRASAWQFLQWAFMAINFFLSAWAFDIPLSFISAILLTSTVFVSDAMSFFVPATLGAQEVGLLTIGTLLGLSPAEAITLALIQRTSAFIIYLPSLLIWKYKKKS